MRISTSPTLATSFEIVGVEIAASLLGIKISTLYSWVHQRKIPHRKHGSRLCFCRGDLEKWSNSQKVEPIHYAFSSPDRLDKSAFPVFDAGRSLKTEYNENEATSKTGG